MELPGKVGPGRRDAEVECLILIEVLVAEAVGDEARRERNLLGGERCKGNVHQNLDKETGEAGLLTKNDSFVGMLVAVQVLDALYVQRRHRPR